jgi:hypothetical protein
MKTRILQRTKKRAGTLLTTLIICSVLGVAVVGYLAVIEQQHGLNIRSQMWNIAMGVVEAGVEEGLQHLNENRTNMLSEGWQKSGLYYYKSNTLTGGNSYLVGIDVDTDPAHPGIVCRAFVDPVNVSKYQNSFYFAAAGFAPSPGTFSRAVRVRTSRGSLFLAALVAKHTIDLNGNGVLTDSFDSGDPARSTGGQYDPNKVGDRGDVATNDGIVNALDIGNANIYGIARTGPGGSVAIGPNGGIGSHDWQATHTGIQSNWFRTDANFTFPDTALPSTAGYLTPPAGDVVLPVYHVITNTVVTSDPSGLGASGVSSNVVSTTTVSTVPNPPPVGLVTNVSYATVSSLPSNPPLGTTTNTVMVYNSPTLPYPLPDGVVTNTTWVNNSATLPSPIPPGTTTNFTPNVRSNNRPADGSYMPGTLYQNDGKYYYSAITGYNYPRFSYTYPTYTYTYPIYTYSYPNFSYSYNTFATNVTYTTNHYDHVLSGGNYVVSSLTGKTIITGPSVLVAPNGISMSGSDSITVAQGGSVTVYAGGSSVSIGGNGVINLPGYAANFIVYCAPSVTSVSLGGNGTFVGILVAPNGDLTLNGSGSTEFDVVGAVLVNSARMNGHFKFHYDEALERMMNNGRFLVTSWDEIP